MTAYSSSEWSKDNFEIATPSVEENGMEMVEQVGHVSHSTDNGIVVAGQEGIPRADEGKHAWLFLAGCFVFEALVWGDHPISELKLGC